MVNSPSITDRVMDVRQRIDEALSRSGRKGEAVQLVAVTKTRTIDEMIGAARAGVDAIGENRVQEALVKHRFWPEDVPTPWHMVGHLQRNKARKALEVFSCIQSLSGKALADTLERLAREKHLTLKVLLEVNISGEESKHGVMPGDAKELAEHVLRLCPRLQLEGFMGIAPLTEREREWRIAFSRLRELGDSLSSSLGQAFPVLSMGMSSDFEVAVKEGSTMVRVGTALFGVRQTR